MVIHEIKGDEVKAVITKWDKSINVAFRATEGEEEIGDFGFYKMYDLSVLGTEVAESKAIAYANKIVFGQEIN